MIGTLYKWNHIHGYGFFRTTSPSGVFSEFFLHVSSIKTGEPVVGATATFEVGRLLKGIVPPAINVRFEERFEVQEPSVLGSAPEFASISAAI